MRVLVIGGGGFLGSNIVRRLLDRGDAVRVLGRSRYPAVEAWGAEAHQGSVTDSQVVRAAVDGVDAVVHTAARVGYWGPYREYWEGNVMGTQNVIDACREAQVRRLVYTSTPSVAIGPKGGIEGADESAGYPDRYLNAYGPTKAEAERRVLAADDAGGLRAAALRPHIIYGPGDPHVAPRLVARSKEGRLAQVGDGTNLVDVTYIDNAVEAHLRVLDELGEAGSRVPGQAYFIGNREPVNLWDFSRQILSGLEAPPVKKKLSLALAWAVGLSLEGIYTGLRLRGEPPLTRMAAIILGTSHWFRHDRAARDFGYVPRVSTEEGLQRLFDHHRQPRPAS